MMEASEKRVLVTGANGFIGSHIIAQVINTLIFNTYKIGRTSIYMTTYFVLCFSCWKEVTL